MLTQTFADAMVEAEKIIADAPHVRTERATESVSIVALI